MKKESEKYSPDFLNSLVRQLRALWADDPNIKHISWGLGKSKGKHNKGICIIFSVHRKVDSEKIRKSIGTALIPDHIEGVPTDVRESNPHKLASAVGSRGDDIADPLNGGWTTSNADNHTIWFNGWGTIALLCTDNTNGDLMALSNWHVWADGGEEGNTIIQPGIPRVGDFVEGTTKVLACGPLLTSLLEWESPDPIAAGLYGGAAAAAIAAALSDYRDPSRRGQDATVPGPGEKTVMEKIIVDTSYLDLPVPGTPFNVDVKWHYSRKTDANLYEHTVSEPQVNTQFLLAKYVISDKQVYNPGDLAHIYAAIWDYQPRPCDGYHVVAHMIPEHSPSTAYPIVLHPIPCPKNLPWYPLDDKKEKMACYDFGQHKPGLKFSSPHAFSWLKCYALDKSDLLITDWQTAGGGQGLGELMIGDRGLRFVHNPCSGVRIKLVSFTSRSITLTAFDPNGNLISTVESHGNSGMVDTLSINVHGISSVVIVGGGGEGVILEYCILTELMSEMVTEIKPEMLKRLEMAHVKYKNIDGNRVRATRCCFHGSFRLPPMEPKGKWNVYLTVQNVNQVPQGTKPELAAEIIGGHLLAAPVAQVAGCAFMMLGDHVFDIF